MIKNSKYNKLTIKIETSTITVFNNKRLNSNDIPVYKIKFCSYTNAKRKNSIYRINHYIYIIFVVIYIFTFCNVFEGVISD